MRPRLVEMRPPSKFNFCFLFHFTLIILYLFCCFDFVAIKNVFICICNVFMIFTRLGAVVATLGIAASAFASLSPYDPALTNQYSNPYKAINLLPNGPLELYPYDFSSNTKVRLIKQNPSVIVYSKSDVAYTSRMRHF